MSPALIASRSQTVLKLSKIGRNVKHLVIVSEVKWAAWLHVLPLFLSKVGGVVKVTVLVPSKSCVQFFGLERESRVSWMIFDVMKSVSRAYKKVLVSVFNNASLVLFSGTAPGIRNLVSWMDDHNCLIAIISGKARLSALAPCKALQWTRQKHCNVGGATDGCFWIGCNKPISIGDSTSSAYCPISMRDLIEFAPKQVPTTMHPAPESIISTSRLASTCPHHSNSLCFWSQGLFPFQHLRSSSSNKVQIICPTPFTTTGWCVRKPTTKEVARFLDFSVAVERRLAKAITSSVPECHPVRQGVPVKILHHALFMCGYCIIFTSDHAN